MYDVDAMKRLTSRLATYSTFTNNFTKLTNGMTFADYSWEYNRICASFDQNTMSCAYVLLKRKAQNWDPWGIWRATVCPNVLNFLLWVQTVIKDTCI